MGGNEQYIIYKLILTNINKTNPLSWSKGFEQKGAPIILLRRSRTWPWLWRGPRPRPGSRLWPAQRRKTKMQADIRENKEIPVSLTVLPGWFHRRCRPWSRRWPRDWSFWWSAAAQLKKITNNLRQSKFLRKLNSINNLIKKNTFWSFLGFYSCCDS